ncbi:MAG TPA: anaerobic sulfatase maturase [Bacteroidales bacterium]|nr:anaerobic sulfatase maturase [Bacteroidales bacterium]
MQDSTREFQVFAKPVGPRCNLACDYCYYLEKGSLFSGESNTVMSYGLLEKYIKQHIEATTDQQVSFSWHGGEPILAGIDFFRSMVTLQRNYKPEGKAIINGIQTNGTLLDKEWCRFLSEESFLVGLSIDGPPEMHNAHRQTAGGGETHDLALQGWKLLKQFGISYEILCVINSLNVKYPPEVYRYFRDSGALFITFLPLVERTGGVISDRTVPSEAFGDFLIAVFEEWKANDIGRIKVQVFEEALRTAFHQDHTLCIFKKDCGGVPVVEHNGDFFSCDHYVDHNHLIGNIGDQSLASMLDSSRQGDFGRLKSETLPAYCRDCEVVDMCNGECPRNRFITTPDGEAGLNYLCAGYKKFFSHCRPFTKAVAHLWRQQSSG